MEIISEKLKKLITWTHTPEPEQLAGILEAMTDGDLMIAMTYFRATPAGRIAWAEYGNRAGFFHFKVHTAVMDGKVQVRFEAEAKPIHYGPIVRKS